jgi:2-oxoglutarate ferredoxin oxidoreductase subunit alpha
LEEHDFCFVVEQNRDAQLRSLLTLETNVAKDKLRSILVYGGFPLSAKHVINGIMSSLGIPEPPAAELLATGSGPQETQIED